jgi:hypothetical protein
VKSAEAVANRVLFYRQEARKRDLDNALVEQEIKQAKIETVEKAYDFVKKLERDGMTKERASRIMAELLDRQGATLSIEAPKEQEPGLRM